VRTACYLLACRADHALPFSTRVASFTSFQNRGTKYRADLQADQRHSSFPLPDPVKGISFNGITPAVLFSLIINGIFPLLI
jgi:hypothetical protein